MNFVERIINHSNLYNVFRYSSISNAFVEMLSSKTKRNIDFYKSFLPAERGALVFDIGANKGNKAYAFNKMGYNVVCFEPERKSLETLNYRFKNNANIKIVNKGVSDSEKVLTLHVHDFRSGYNTLSNKWVDVLQNSNENRWHKEMNILESYDVQTTTLDKLIDEFGMPLYAKIDVEGYELEVVKGLSKKIPFITFEANLPEFSSETKEIVNRLASINSNVQFIVTHSEQLVGDNWMSAHEMLKYVDTTDLRVIEVIAKN